MVRKTIKKCQLNLRWWKVSAKEVGEKPFILARLSLANLNVQNAHF